MRIDKVEEIWSNLETNYKMSDFKSRRKFVEGLTSFNGIKGAVQPLISLMCDDLDDSADAIARYTALCKMLESAEEWLITNKCEIPDLDDWMQRLGKSRQLDVRHISTTFKPDIEELLVDSIKTGFILPGIYDKMTALTFPTAFDGYIFFDSTADISAKLPEILTRIRNPKAVFDRHVANILQRGFADRTLKTPCVFVSSHLLKTPIVKYHKKKSVKEKEVPVIESSSMLMDLDYDIGTVDVSAATSVPVYIIRQ